MLSTEMSRSWEVKWGFHTPGACRTLGGGCKQAQHPQQVKGRWGLSLLHPPPLSPPRGWDLASLLGAEPGTCWDEDIRSCLQGSCPLLLLRHIAALRSRTVQASLGVFLLPSLPADTGRGKQGGNTTKSRSATPGNPTPCSQLSVLECRAPGASPLPGLAAPRGHRRGWVPTATCKPPPLPPSSGKQRLLSACPTSSPLLLHTTALTYTQPLEGGGGRRGGVLLAFCRWKMERMPWCRRRMRSYIPPLSLGRLCAAGGARAHPLDPRPGATVR